MTRADANSGRGLKIGAFAAALGVPVSTVRFYERSGLLGAGSRSPGGFRLFGERDLSTGRFVCAARRAGLTLADTRLLLGLARGHRGRGPDALRRAIQERIGTVERELEGLRRTRSVLTRALGRSPATPGPRDPAALLHLLRGRS